MKRSPAPRVPRVFTVALAVAHFIGQAVLGHAAEANFWAQRAETARRFRGGAVTPAPFWGALPLDVPPVGGRDILPSSTDWARVFGGHGHVRGHQLGARGVVLHVQDVHGHRNAQKNIAALVRAVLDRHPRATVLLEGAAGPISLESLRSAGDDRNAAVAGFFFNAGILSGAEAAVYGVPGTPRVVGAEDPGRYIANRRAVDAARAARPVWERRLSDWTGAVQSAKAAVYSARALALDRRADSWSGEGAFLERAAFLVAAPDLPPPSPGSALERFGRLIALEKSLSPEAATRERGVFLEQLADRLSPVEVQSLAADAMALRGGAISPGAFYAGVRALAARRGVRLGEFPAFDDYVAYTALGESVRPETLEAELNDREARLWTTVAATPPERDLRAVDEALREMRRLIALSMTPADWRAHLAGGADRDRLKRRLAAVGVTAPGFDGLEVFESFYRLAEARNHALAEAAETAARAGEPVVLVAGGFHNSGVAALLAERGVEFLSVAPKLGDTADPARGPFDIFFRDHTPLEELFQAPRISLAETPGLAPLTPDGIPRARALRELGPLVRSALASPGVPQAAPAQDGGRTIVVARSPEDPEPTVAGARPVVTAVPVDLEGLSKGSDVSVFHRNGPPWGRWWGRWKSSQGFFAEGRSKLLGAALLAALLIPLAAVSPAHAYTLVEGPAGVQVMVEKGEHLWGAARTVLKAEGNPKPANAEIDAKVKEMAALNGLTNPDLIHPQTLYMATPAPVPGGSPVKAVSPAGLSGGDQADVAPAIVPLDTGTTGPPFSPSISPVAPPAVAGAGIDSAASAGAGPTAPLPSTNARGDSVFPAPTAGFVAAVAAAMLLLTAWGGRAHSQLRLGRAAHRAWNRAGQSAREGTAAIAEVLHPTTGKGRDPLASFLLVATMIATLALVPGAADWGPAMFAWFDVAELVDHTRAFLVGQWPMLAALGTGLFGAVYYVWFRAKEVDLSAIEKNEPRVRDWINLLDRLEQNETLREEDLSWLANNVHALILNNRVTPVAVSDRGQMEKRIDAYRAIARLSERTVHLLDRRLETGAFAVGNTRDRLVDTREKFFLYQLYGLKTAHALVPASVAHWALSNYDRQDSWFEKKKLGAVLRFVRGVRPMIRQTVEEYRGRMLTDDTRPGRTLWERAEGLSVVSLGNILVPGLYDEQEKSDLARVFQSLQKKSETKELSDMSAKDLHRKGWGTMISLLLWSVAISRMVSVFPAVLAFLTGLGVTMALFRIQTLGTRRDGFFREGLKNWREKNQRPHVNGRLKGNGESAGEDPFHLNRDFARFHFQEAENALRGELAAGEPSTDIVLLIAQNEEERAYFESRATDRTLFHPSVPVVVLTVPARRGSFAAYARAWTYLFSDEYKSLAERHPRLKGRAPWTLNAATLVAKGGAVEGMSRPLAGLPLFANRLGAGALGDRTIFDLAVMNAYRATRARTEGGERGGLALRWADRAYVGPVRVAAGTGVTLDTQWVNREDMDRFNFGAVIASLDKPIKLIRRSRVEKTLGLLAEEHTNRVYDLRNDRLKQIQAFSGEGFYAFDEAAAAAHHEFLGDVIARSDSLPAEANLDPPSLNLMTYYLVPLCIAQARDAEVSHKINVYFSGHGFLSDPLPEAIQRFNNRSANALAATFREEARPTFSLNAAFVDESLYASVDAAVEQDEAEFDPGTEPPDAPRWRDRLRRAVRNGTVHSFLLLGMFFPAMAAAAPKGAAVEAAWGGPAPYVAAVAGASLPSGAAWRRAWAGLRALTSLPGSRLWGGASPALLVGSGLTFAAGNSEGAPDRNGAGWAVAAGLGAVAMWVAGAVRTARGRLRRYSVDAKTTDRSGPSEKEPPPGPMDRRPPRDPAPGSKIATSESQPAFLPGDRAGIFPAAGDSLPRRWGQAVLDRLTAGKALMGVKIALLPVALFVNYGGLVQAFGSAGALVFAPALLLIPAFFLTVFELFVDDLIARRLGIAPAPVSSAAPRGSARRSTALDVTTESWSHPAETVTALAEILSAMRSSDRRNAAGERELTRLLVRAAAELPLEDDLAGRLSLSWLRADVAKAEEIRARRRTRRAADPRGERRARIDEVAEVSLAHQIARAWRTHRRGVVPAAEFRQAWYLRGLMGRPLPDHPAGDALLGTLGALWGVAGVGGAREWSNGARKLAGLLKGVPGVPAGDAEAELTMIRVSEFLPGAGEGAARRPVLEKHLIERAKRFRPGADAGDVLIVNGRGADETRIKNLLRRRVSGFPAFDAYLAACRVVVLPEERFTPEAVIAALPNTTTRGKTLNFFTADPTAILIDPHRTHLSYRVLLLEWVGGGLMAVDLLDLARRALKAARVVATSA